MIFRIGEVPAYKNVITGLAGIYSILAREDTRREDFPGSPHKDTQTVYLTMPFIVDALDIFTEMEAPVRQVLSDSPLVQDIISECMYMIGASRLGRTMLVNLKAGGEIPPHVDEGIYYSVHYRYHLPIVTNKDVKFISGDKDYNLEEGVLYELANEEKHSVQNNSTDSRLHLIMDMQLLSEVGENLDDNTHHHTR